MRNRSFVRPLLYKGPPDGWIRRRIAVGGDLRALF